MKKNLRGETRSGTQAVQADAEPHEVPLCCRVAEGSGGVGGVDQSGSNSSRLIARENLREALPVAR